MQALNWIDYAIIIIVGLSSIISLVRGFIREALSLASWIIAFWVALTFSKNLAIFLQPYITSDPLRYGAAFFILFAATLLLGAFVNSLITHLVEKTGLSGTDRMLGVVFGFGRGLLLVAILLLAAHMTALPQGQSWQQSRFIPTFQPLETWLAQYIPKNFKSAQELKYKLPNSATLNLTSKGAIEKNAKGISTASNDSKMLKQQEYS